MNIYIGIATGNRAKQAVEVVRSWNNRKINVAVITWDQETMDLLNEEFGTDITIVKTGNRESFAVNQNHLMAEIPDWDVWICGADDLWAGGQPDLKDRIELIAGNSEDKLIWVADGCLNEQPTHPIITRRMYDAEDQKIFDAGYEHNFVDTDLFARMLEKMKVLKCFDIVLDHRHHLNGRAEMDEIYNIGQGSFPQDAVKYHNKWGDRLLTMDYVEVMEIEQATN